MVLPVEFDPRTPQRAGWRVGRLRRAHHPIGDLVLFQRGIPSDLSVWPRYRPKFKNTNRAEKSLRPRLRGAPVEQLDDPRVEFDLCRRFAKIDSFTYFDVRGLCIR